MEQDIKELYKKIGLVIVIVAIIQGIALFAGPGGQSGVDVSGIRADRDPNAPPLRCAPSLVLGRSGELVAFAASGGTDIYLWSAPGGTPSAGTGAVFATRYPGGGPKTRQVTVSSGSGPAYQQSSCIVTF